jgi:transposase
MEPVDGAPCFFSGLLTLGGCGLPTTDTLADCFVTGNGKIQGGMQIDPSGYDAGKRINGKKRHILVDTLGLLLHAIVHPADVQDRDGGALLLSSLFGMYPFLLKLFADAGYQGPQFANAVAKRLPQLAVGIVKRSDLANGFEVLPMRWVVERTLAWLNRCRRLSKDFENLTDNALAFLRLASIRLMLRRLCNPS